MTLTSIILQLLSGNGPDRIQEKDMQYQELTGDDSGRICKSFKSDCVIRAISVAANLPYRKVFEDLMAIGLEIGAYPNHEKVWQRYLEQDLGWVRNKPPRDHLNKMIKLRNWDGPNAAVVRNSRHLTAVSDGRVVDTWDCTYRPVNTYWTPA